MLTLDREKRLTLSSVSEPLAFFEDGLELDEAFLLQS